MPQLKLYYDYVKDYFKSQGCELISKQYVNSKADLRYRCKCGKLRITCWNNFSRMKRCKFCIIKATAGVKRKQVQALQLRERVLNVSEVARLFKVRLDDMYKAISEERLPAPEVQIPGKIRRYYDEAGIRRLAKMIVL